MVNIGCVKTDEGFHREFFATPRKDGMYAVQIRTWSQFGQLEYKTIHISRNLVAAKRWVKKQEVEE